MRLALAWGQWDVEAFAKQLSPRVFDYWLAYDQVEPWGQYHADEMSANTTSFLCAAQGMELDPRDLLWWEEEIPSTQAEIDAQVGLFLARVQASVKHVR